MHSFLVKRNELENKLIVSPWKYKHFHVVSNLLKDFKKYKKILFLFSKIQIFLTFHFSKREKRSFISLFNVLLSKFNVTCIFVQIFFFHSSFYIILNF